MFFEILHNLWSFAKLIIGNVLTLVEPEWNILIDERVIPYLLISAFCGGLVGLEREHAEKPAGLRTNMFICVGSCLFTLASIFSWRYIAGETSPVDPGRIAAQIVSGIGFLGAGVILKIRDEYIIGITTASTIWMVAAIGMVIGLGFPLLGLIVSTITTLLLFLLGRIELSVWFSPKSSRK